MALSLLSCYNRLGEVTDRRKGSGNMEQCTALPSALRRALGGLVALLGVALSAASCGFGAPEDPGINLLLNPGFEETASPGLAWSLGESSSLVAGPQGGRVLYADARSGRYAVTSQDVVLRPGVDRVVVSGRVKYTGIVPRESWGGARFLLVFRDQRRQQIGGWPTPVVLKGTGDWTEARGEVKVPEGARLVSLMVGMQDATGEAWFDDLRLMAFQGDRPMERVENSRTDTRGWYAFPGAKPAVFPGQGAAIDASFLQDAPAGKRGFVTVKDGHFAFTRGGRVRFWGVNIVANNPFRDHLTASRVAERLAKAGVNMVRLHHMDASWADPNIFDPAYDDTQHLSKQSLDNLDFLVSELKKRGIYIYMDLLVHRKFKQGDGVRDWEQVENGAKVVAHFNPRIIELQKDYARKLLTHVNAYTGKAYVDEPAIAMMEIINESSLFWPGGYDSIPPSYKQEIRDLFEAWCAKKGATAPAGAVADLLRQKNPQVLQFLTDLQDGYFQDMRTFLRSLGVKVPITGSNHWENWGADLLTNARMDYIDRHGYWDHPSGGFSPTDRFSNASMLLSPLQSLPMLGRQRVQDKPFIVTEWNNVWMNEYIAEGPLVMAAYGALQDWDGLLQFDYYGADWLDSMQSCFDVGNKPHVFAQYPAAAMLFRRGDVAAARRIAFGDLTAEEMMKGEPAGGDLPPGAPLTHRPSVYLEGLGTKPEAPAARAESVSTQTFESDTGQLRWDGEAGLVTLQAPAAAAAVGTMPGKPLELGDATLRLRTPFASVSVVTLDGKPIRQSRRLLLTAVARAENTGQVYNPTRTSLTNLGRAPILMQPVEGEVTLNLAKGVRWEAYALDAWGGRKERLSLLEEGGKYRLLLGADETPWHEIVAAR